MLTLSDQTDRTTGQSITAILSAKNGRREKESRWHIQFHIVTGVCEKNNPLENTVSFHNFKSQNFKLSVSNPRSKYVAHVSVLSPISNCQSLGRKNKHDILKTDRKTCGKTSFPECQIRGWRAVSAAGWRGRRSPQRSVVLTDTGSGVVLGSSGISYCKMLSVASTLR